MMRRTMSIIALLWAIGLSITSLLMPPAGVIDASVLILLAQIIVFIATLTGITLPSMFNKLETNNSRKP